jgi:hypothetical protein
MQLMGFAESVKILSKYNIPSCRSFFTVSENEALDFAKKLKYPLFLKVSGKDILHRTDIKGVFGDIKTEEELSIAFKELMKIKNADGVIMQEMISGKEIIIGMKRDAQFGPTIIVGIGGIFAELIKDVVLKVAPVSEKEALEMLADLKGYPYLCGIRDDKKINLKTVAKIIVAVSDVGLKEKEIKEITLNPVIANKKNAFAVDSKFLV